ncbi:ATP-dependent DNA helicase [Durusdinium trenchii]|uniref:ATP-dependent DNA helicase n=1 Tax=Durusdinium trenchii TaxID=1381693 RepID=A0ABP0HBV7_9DINO
MVKSKKEKKEVTEEKPLPPAKSIFEVKATSGRARLGELASALPTPAFTQLTSRGMPQCLRPEVLVAMTEAPLYQLPVGDLLLRQETPSQAWQQDKEEVEAEWPEYKNSLLMLTRPTYQMDAEMTPAAWKQQYLEEDVEQLQQKKQHHVHLPDGPKGEHRPLAHCRDAQTRDNGIQST